MMVQIQRRKIDFAGDMISRKKYSELRITGLKTLNELAEGPIRIFIKSYFMQVLSSPGLLGTLLPQSHLDYDLLHSLQ